MGRVGSGAATASKIGGGAETGLEWSCICVQNIGGGAAVGLLRAEITRPKYTFIETPSFAVTRWQTIHPATTKYIFIHSPI